MLEATALPTVPQFLAMLYLVCFNAVVSVRLMPLRKLDGEFDALLVGVGTVSVELD